MIYLGEQAFEVAVANPDDLVPFLEQGVGVGLEGIGYVVEHLLEARHDDWEVRFPFAVVEGLSEPTGVPSAIPFPGWDAPKPQREEYSRLREEELRRRFPKVCGRFGNWMEQQ